MFTQPTQDFPDVFHEGYKKPQEIILFGNLDTDLNMDSSLSNVFMGPTKDINQLAEKIFLHKQNEEKDYEGNDYDLIAKWDLDGLSMLATFQQADSYDGNSPLHMYIKASKISDEILSLASDCNSNSGPELVYENLTRDFQDSVIDEITFKKMERLLMTNLSPNAVNDLVQYFDVSPEYKVNKLKM
jgi:hypothetical protein